MAEHKLYSWALSELENTPQFIIYESESILGANGRDLTTADGLVITRTFTYLAEIFAILNYTPDSFSDGDKYNSIDKVLAHIIDLTDNGAAVIDIGVESTNPNSTALTDYEEKRRLQQILAPVLSLKRERGFSISIDTYHSSTVHWLLDQDVDYINDVSGKLPPSLVKACIDSSKHYIAMHSLTVPASCKHVLDVNINPISYLNDWIKAKTLTFMEHGINMEKIIFDPGIGFGKSAAQSGYIINNIEQLDHASSELLVGHSRKSWLKHLMSSSAAISDDNAYRDIFSAIIAALLISRKVDYLRLHDIKLLNAIYPYLYYR